MNTWPKEALEAYRNLRTETSKCERRETELRKTLEGIVEQGKQYFSKSPIGAKMAREAKRTLIKLYGDKYE
ncbi:hypothetical protein D3C73_1419380 [compost metagenome]